MAIKTTAVSVGTTPTRLDSATETDTTGGSTVILFNNGAAAVFIGDASVTTASGISIAVAALSPEIHLDNGEALYGIVASGTADVRVLEHGV